MSSSVRTLKRPHSASRCVDGSSSRFASSEDSPRSSAGSDVDHMDIHTRQFALEHQVHDVDEHFRRSLASMQSKPPPTMSAPVSAYSAAQAESRTKRSRTSGEGGESHQIVIAENAASSQPQLQPVPTTPRVTTCATPTLIPTVTSQGIQYILSPAGATGTVGSTPGILTRVSSNGTTPIRAAIQTPQVLYNIPAAAAAASKVINGGAAVAMATSAADTAARESSIKKGPTVADALAASISQNMTPSGGMVFPSLAPSMATTATPTQPSFIPILDSSGGVPQLLTTGPTAAAASNGAVTAGTTPMFFLSPGQLPMMSPGGFVFISPTATAATATDLSTIQQSQAGIISTATSNPSVILVPPTFQMQPGLVPSVTDQIVTLAAQNAAASAPTTIQQQQQKKAEIIVNSKSSPPAMERRASSAHSIGHASPASISSPLHSGDSVEDHFARALGEQKWKQVKQCIEVAPPQNKIQA